VNAVILLFSPSQPVPEEAVATATAAAIWRLLAALAFVFVAMASAPNLQTAGGPDFGDGQFQPDDMVTVHSVSNLEEGLTAKIIAFDPDATLYVVKDAAGNIWGLKAQKLRLLQTLKLDEGGNEWQRVTPGVVIPGGVEVKMDLSTGTKLARRVVVQQQPQAAVVAADPDESA
jgi:hypothetical protein